MINFENECTYRIRSRKYKVVEVHKVSPNLGRFFVQIVTVEGKRNAAYLVHVRKDKKSGFMMSKNAHTTEFTDTDIEKICPTA